MRGLIFAVLLSLLILGLSQPSAADDAAKDVKKDPNPPVAGKDDAPKNSKETDAAKKDAKDAPKTEPAKDAPKTEPGKDVPKTEPGKDAPKPEPGKDAPKNAPKPDATKDVPKTEPAKKNAPMDTPKDEMKVEVKKDNGMIKVGEIQGKVVNIDESKKSIKLSVPVLNPDVVMALARAEADLQRVTMQPNQNPFQQAQAIMNAQNSIAQNQMKLFSKTVDVELTATEDLIVRLHQPAPQFDDRGKLKRLTAKEKAELKGDPKLPGYKGEFSDLRTNQLVKVTLVKSKTAKMPRIKPGMKEIDPAILEELKPHISMIIIMADQRVPAQ